METLEEYLDFAKDIAKHAGEVMLNILNKIMVQVIKEIKPL